MSRSFAKLSALALFAAAAVAQSGAGTARLAPAAAKPSKDREVSVRPMEEPQPDDQAIRDNRTQAGSGASDETKKPAAGLGGMANLAALSMESAPGAMKATIRGPNAGFLGFVLLSLSPEQMHFFTDIPPLLAGAAIMGTGWTDSETLVLGRGYKPLGYELKLYAQAVIFDAQGLGASGVVQTMGS